MSSTAHGATSVREHAFNINRAIDAVNFDDALKHSVKMLSDLVISSETLSPSDYFGLWNQVLDQLSHLQAFFLDLNRRHGVNMVDIYQRVQSVRELLPRLYLLATAGAATIESQEAPAKEILDDLVAMNKGVQHPIRGLFLRYYTSRIGRHYLLNTLSSASSGNEENGISLASQNKNDIGVTIDFILKNFVEMNRLWIRMQNQDKDKSRRERQEERKKLGVTIGDNISILSTVEEIDIDIYKSLVLPRLIEEMINCKDQISQEYIFDTVVSAFPDDFHILTLDDLCGLISGGHLHHEVNLNLMFSSLFDRIEELMKGIEEGKLPEHLESLPTFASVQAPALFAILEKHISLASSSLFAPPKPATEAATQAEGSAKPVQPHSSANSSGFQKSKITVGLSLYVSLMKFSVAIAPTNLERVDRILKHAADFLSKLVETEHGDIDPSDIIGQDAESEITTLLTEPLRLASVQILNMVNYPRVMKFINWEARKEVAAEILRAILGSKVEVSDPQFLDKLLTFVSPLIQDDPDTPTDDTVTSTLSRSFEEHQTLVSKLVHCIKHEDPNQHFLLLNVARKHFSRGGKQRIRYTLAPLCFEYFNLVRAMSAKLVGSSEAQSKKEGDDEKEKEENKETVEEDDDIAAMLRSNANKIEAGDDKDDAQESVTCRYVLKGVHEIITALLSVEENKSLALRLYLNAAIIADAAAEESASYEFMAQSFTLYEEISNSATQMSTLLLMIGSLQVMRRFSKDNYHILYTKIVQYAGSMLKKQDQAKMLLQCVHLSSNPDEKKNCLQRSLKCAQASPNHINLYIEILNRYLILFVEGDQGASVKPQTISGLISVIQEEIAAVKSKNAKTADDESTFKFFDETVAIVKKDSRYSEIKDLLVA